MPGDNHDLVLAQVRLGDRPVDLGLNGGLIARIAPAGTLNGRVMEACDGLLALPGLVDGHIHLDKTFLCLP